jgi:hypothetical protein
MSTRRGFLPVAVLLRTPAELHRSFRDQVLSEAVTEYATA